MTDAFPACLAFTLREEGGYSNDPRDPGGATNLGITTATLAHWRGRPVTPADVRGLDQTEAAAIYHALYWQALRCWGLPVGVDLLVFDFGVNAGPGTSARELQATLGVPQDGMIGPVTALAARGAGRPLAAALATAHEAHYRALPGFPIYGDGWLGRLGRCATLAATMAGTTG